MKINVTFDTEIASDRELLTIVLGNAAPAAPAETEIAEPEVKRGPGRPRKEATPIAPAPEEDLLGDDDEETFTKEQVVQAATKALGEGRSAQVKEVLTALGKARVRDLEPGQYAEFVKKLA